MSLLNLLEKKHSNIKKIDENIIDGSKLLLDNPISNTKSRVIDETPIFRDSSISHLYNVRNLKTPLSFFYYLTDTYFIGVLSDEDIYNIKTYNDLYKIYLNKLFSVNIIEINVSEKKIISNIHLVIVKTSFCELLPNKKKLDLIKPTEFINCEQINNTFITQDKDNNFFNLSVENITINSLIVDSSYKLVQGSPLFTNNVLVGICGVEQNNKIIFFRISYFLDWINKFNKDYIKVKNSSLPKNVVFTQDQFYSIIIELNKKVEILENDLKEQEKKSSKIPFQDIITKNFQSNENQLLKTID